MDISQPELSKLEATLMTAFVKAQQLIDIYDSESLNTKAFKSFKSLFEHSVLEEHPVTAPVQETLLLSKKIDKELERPESDNLRTDWALFAHISAEAIYEYKKATDTELYYHDYLRYVEALLLTRDIDSRNKNRGYQKVITLATEGIENSVVWSPQEPEVVQTLQYYKAFAFLKLGLLDIAKDEALKVSLNNGEALPEKDFKYYSEETIRLDHKVLDLIKTIDSCKDHNSRVLESIKPSEHVIL